MANGDANATFTFTLGGTDMATVITYNVYHAPEGGSALSFFGTAKTLAEAKELIAGGRTLCESLWGTARASGHCDGLYAPEGTEDEDESSIEWLGTDCCAIPVID